MKGKNNTELDLRHDEIETSENDLDSLEQEESWVSLQNPHDLCINIITPNIFGSY